MTTRSIGTGLSLVLLAACSAGPRATLEPRTVSVFSSPSGAEVYRVGPITDQRLLLGTTPLRDQRVDVLTHYRGRFITEADVEAMAARIGKLHLIVEKPGYRPHQAMLSMADGEPQSYRAELEPVDG